MSMPMYTLFYCPNCVLTTTLCPMVVTVSTLIDTTAVGLCFSVLLDACSYSVCKPLFRGSLTVVSITVSPVLV